MTADPDEVYKAVEDWMETIRSSIANKEGEIERLKKTLKDKEDEITDLKELNIKTNEEKHQYENIVSSKIFIATLVVLTYILSLIEFHLQT